MFPATLFDYNGVLVDDEAVHFAALRDAVRPLGVALGREQYWERYLGFDDLGALRAILADAGRAAPPDLVAALLQAKAQLYLESARRELCVFPGAAELVRRRAAVGPVVIVSGALRHEVEFGLTHLGVRAAISNIIAAEDTTECKPSPQGYRIAMDRLGEVGQRALVVEDSMAGVQAAKTAGLPCVAVAHSYAAQRLLASGADWVAPRLGDVTDAVLGDLYRRLYG